MTNLDGKHCADDCRRRAALYYDKDGVSQEIHRATRCAMLTVEQILSRLNELRKEYQDDDDPDNEQYLALHHAFLFLSYQMDAFRKYLAEQNAKQKK
jgi:hypothetical protein